MVKPEKCTVAIEEMKLLAVQSCFHLIITFGIMFGFREAIMN
jgi:hypothetical protein